MTTMMLPEAETMRRLLGDVDLSDGTCAHSDPLIWTGDWVSQPGQGEKARRIRQDSLTRAVALCQDCPVLAACERQLQAFETEGREVFGIMAGRRWRTGLSAYAQTRGTAEGMPCITCGRTMHIRPTSIPVRHWPVLPDGHAYFAAREMCRACYYRDIENPAQRERRARAATHTTERTTS